MKCQAFSGSEEELDAAIKTTSRATWRYLTGRATEEEKAAFSLANEANNLSKAGHRLTDCPVCIEAQMLCQTEVRQEDGRP